VVVTAGASVVAAGVVGCVGAALGLWVFVALLFEVLEGFLAFGLLSEWALDFPDFLV
jgi:hypothetical protein